VRLENIGTLCKRVRRPSSGQAEAKQQPTQRQPLFQKEGGVKRDLRMQFDDNFRLLSTASGSLERESVSLSLYWSPKLVPCLEGQLSVGAACC